MGLTMLGDAYLSQSLGDLMGDVPRSDMLASIFAMQADLNDNVFRSNGCRGRAGDVLSMAAICRDAQERRLSVNDLPNEWLCKYSAAIDAELTSVRAHHCRFRSSCIPAWLGDGCNRK